MLKQWSKFLNQKNLKAVYPILFRVAVFLVLFVIFSGILGPRIISHGLVNKDGFQIYGGAGKALLFGVICLAILVYRKGIDVVLKKWTYINVIWLVLAVLSLILAWVSVGKLIAGVSGLEWPILAHVGLLLSIIFALIGSFGLSDLMSLLKRYKREILISIGLAVLFYIFLYAVYSLWGVLAYVVLYSVRPLLQVSGVSAEIVKPNILLLSKFGIQIAEYCSGIESIALFTGLFAVIGVLDWHRFNHKKLFWVFVPALVVLFGFNILRVYGLILAGFYIDQQIAFSLFHTYAGMVFFILYSIIFWGVSYKWLLQKQS